MRGNALAISKKNLKLKYKKQEQLIELKLSKFYLLIMLHPFILSAVLLLLFGYAPLLCLHPFPPRRTMLSNISCGQM
jgi:hypothetical protein